ncbi:helix-turn-helix transcriptional regulator [Dysgonomonas sp. GY617]|uniref:S24 family peptidase n=1 Tax=Dysgonomonas sp. GY617 TaxID=2780420 RepID=UPI00188332E1|nr:LexA family transcriptional regulator [Dysgonomonas sp. GY617]MBF0576634.1 hypothetical protein [Dysgonomonas sp. GY617]
MVERLEQFVEYLRISIRAFELKIGASNGLIRKAITNKSDIQSKWITNIVDNYPQLNITWLLTGKGNMLNESDKEQHTNESNNLKYITPEFDSEVLSDKYKPRPYIDSVYATLGVPNGFAIAVKADECERLSIPFVNNYDFSLRGRGDSMINHQNPQRSINDRDLIACKLWKSRSHIRWGEVYALSTSEGVIIKQIMPSDLEGYVRCVSFNEIDGFRPYDLPVAEIYDWAIVVAVLSITNW